MGLSGISPASLLLILLIALVLFGSKKISTLGEDLGKAIKGFKKGLNEEEEKNKINDTDNNTEDNTLTKQLKENKLWYV